MGKEVDKERELRAHKVFVQAEWDYLGFLNEVDEASCRDLLAAEAFGRGHSDDEIDAAIQSGTLEELVGDGSRDITDPFLVEIETDACYDDDN